MPGFSEPPGPALVTRRAGWIGLCALVAIVAGMTLPGAAVGDGDPASDALIAQNVFYPYSSPVSAPAQATLNREVAELHRTGLPLKVAIIARASDLGSITALYRDPQRYAAFLDTEISFQARQPLLVVMPDGFGDAGLSATARHAVLSTEPPRGSGGDSLAAAASAAVTSIRRGRARPSRASVSGSRRASDVLLYALIAAALLVIAALVVQRVFFPPAASPAPAVSTARRTHSDDGAGRTARPRRRSRRGG